MKEFIIVIALSIWVNCVPIEELQHPSPVNPDVLVAVKPEERIIFINDPNEIVKFKRETEAEPFYPTVLPNVNEHHEIQQVPSFVNKLRASQDLNKTTLNVRRRRNADSYQVPNKSKPLIQEVQKSQAIPASMVTEEVGHKAIEYKNSGSDEVPASKDIDQNKCAVISSNQCSIVKTKGSSQQGIQKQINNSKEINENIKISSSEVLGTNQAQKKNNLLPFQKRDIPVPLVAKYHHPEESPRESTKKEEHTNQIPSNSTTEELQQPPLLKQNTSVTQQRNEDNPVPLDPKDHHFGHSPKYIKENHNVSQKILHNMEQDTSISNLQQLQTQEASTYLDPHVELPKDKPLSKTNERAQLGTLVSPTQYQSQSLPTQHESIQSFHILSVHKMEQTAPNSQLKVTELEKTPTTQADSNVDKKELKKSNVGHDEREILNDHSSIQELVTSTTQHPIIRPHPVPVSELFSKVHGN